MDTIVAISTPLGRGGIGIIRLSGKLVPDVANKLLGKIPDPRKAEYLPCLDTYGSILERVIAIFFPKPYSFTGENVLEIHGHGGQMILNLLLDRVLEISDEIRLANPGEFTERAFLNGKIDLIQAESIADIIDANSYQAAKSASNSLQGIFSAKINKILKKITNLRTYIESSIDFSDQEISTIPYDKTKSFLEKIIQNVDELVKSTYCGILLKEGIKVVIAGKPNAGKSSLFNSLMEIDRAIVSKIPGTTRDTLCEYIQINGIAYYITDTAGLQEDSTNEVELMGIQRTWDELKSSDHILWVVDSSSFANKNHNDIILFIKKIFYFINREVPVTIIRNKSDLSLETVGVTVIQGYTFITVSALLNNGIDLIKEHLYNIINIQMNRDVSSTFSENHSNFIARKRHLDILKKVKFYLESAKSRLDLNTYIDDCFADDLSFSNKELNKIFGKYSSNDLLEEIFGKFCIGK